MKRSILIFSIALISFLACNQERSNVPKPYSYPRIEFEERSYVPFSQPYCPITFQYPETAEISRKRIDTNEDSDGECWFNMTFPAYDATIYFTYYTMEGLASLDQFVEDAYRLVSKHNDRANSREESNFENKQGLMGTIFQIGGPVASPVQFYITDRQSHFMRGSLYYNNSNATDSLRIVTDFLLEDINTLLATAKFN